MLFKVSDRFIEVKEENLSPEKLAVIKLIAVKKVSQKQIAAMLIDMGCHQKFEVDSVPKAKQQETTERQVRQLVHDLRVDDGAPILSDAKGFWIAKTMEEVIEYLKRRKQQSESAAKSFMVTFHSMQKIFIGKQGQQEFDFDDI